MKKNILAAGAPPALGPYSHAVVVGGFVFVSGQIHLDSDGKLVGNTISERTHQVMKNLQLILVEAGVSFANVVKTTIYVTDMSNYGEINDVYKSYMVDPFPARETVCVKELPMGAEVEISMVAAID